MNKKNSNIVAHNIFGEGTVLETRWEGAESRVRFQNGLVLWLPTRWLKTLIIPEIELDQVAAKRLLEAFRLGVVPHQDIEQFTFGRAYEIDELRQGLMRLKQGQGSVFLIEGGYGAGKTHLLEYLHHIALREGLVTSMCELHIQETPPHRPKKVYHELVYGLRYIKEGCEYGFRDLLRAGGGVEMEDHVFLTPVLKRLADQDADGPASEVFWQWIEGESTKEYATDQTAPYRVRGGYHIPALYDFSTAADFYNYVLSGLSYLVHGLGLGGWVVIIDELETMQHVIDYQQRVRGGEFIEGLVRATLNDDALRSTDDGLMHNRVRPTPYLYRDSHIMLVLTTTPLPEKEKVRSGVRRILLRRFSRLEIEVIFDNLLQVYQRAYPGARIEAGQRENVLNAAMRRNKEELRDMIKYTVEAFDYLRLGRGAAHEEDASSALRR